MKAIKAGKKVLYILLTALLLLTSQFLIIGVNSAYAPLNENNSKSNPDTLIRGIVNEIQYEYKGIFLGGTYKLPALITVMLNETIMKPESFTREINQLVGVSYNYSSLPECKVNDVVEVYGLWIPVLDVPASLTILVSDQVNGSYIHVMPASSPSPSPPTSEDNGQNATINTLGEYSNGSIPLGPGMNLWYTWINASGTQVAFFTYYSEVYNSPIQTFLGQHYMADNDTEVFIGNTLLLMEAYNDMNGNGVPEAELGEIKYFFLVNSSETFTTTPIQKATIENISHYIWGIEYGWVDGALLYPKDQLINGVYTNLAARVNITHLSFMYDYYIQGNVSYLKIGFKTGEIADFEPWTPDVSLDGLGLSLLYGTTMLTTKPYAVLVNGESYNSTAVGASTTSTSRAEIIVEDTKLYEFIFEENYTLYKNSVPQNYRSKSAASPTESIPPNAANYLSPYWLVGWLLRFLSSDVFPKMSASLPDVELRYANSSFVYRVCYPVWEGWSIEHDPTYVAYLVPVKTNVPIPVGPPIKPPHEPSSGPSVGMPSGFSVETIISVAIAVAGIFALAWALIELRRTMRF